MIIKVEKINQLIMKHTLLRKFQLILFVSIVTVSVSVAQQLNSTGLYRHGTNSSSGNSTVASEATDSVTVDSKMDYFVMPDKLYNPAYDPAVSLTNNLVSTFAWTTTPAGPVIATKPGFGQNYVTVTWPGTGGVYTMNVKESNSAGCDDGTGRNISVAVINKPTASFSTSASTQCTATPASQTFQLPLSLSTDINNGRMTVSFSVAYTNTSGTTTTTVYADVPLTETGTLNLETLIGSSLAYGKYVITLTNVKDRISVKSNVAGTLSSTTYTYNLIRLPQTGEIYHVPNI